MKLFERLPKNPILKLFAIIIIVPLVVIVLPFLIGWWLITLIREHTRNKTFKAILIVLIAFFFVSFGSIWTYAFIKVISESPTSTASVIPSPIPTPITSPTQVAPPPVSTQTPTLFPSIKPTPTNLPVAETKIASKCVSLNGLPDSNCTPGSIDTKVTQENLTTTICKSGYTTTVRPSTTYTNNLKAQQIKEYGYVDTRLSSYEEDHLIPLELGGNPTDPKNLWPEYGSIPNPKDTVENGCKSKVCAGQITLAEAQVEIATNWRIACGYSITSLQH